MFLEVASLVVHKDRPGSYGFVNSVHPLTVMWKDPDGTYIGPETCKMDDIETTTCPGCGEGECWCGVGR